MRFLIILLAIFSLTIHAETLRIGIMAFNPPFETEADKNGNFFGYDVDIMTEVCKRIQAECVYKPSSLVQIFSDILSGQTDLGIGAISITELRQQNFLFSLPYMASSGQFIGRADSPFHMVDQLRTKKIASVEGSLFKAMALTRFHDKVTVVEYRNLAEVFQAVANDRVDAAVVDEETAKYWVATNSSVIKLIGEAIPLGIGYGILANKNSTALINRVNQALLGMETDGIYLKIYNRYFMKMT